MLSDIFNRPDFPVYFLLIGLGVTSLGMFVYFILRKAFADGIVEAAERMNKKQ